MDYTRLLRLLAKGKAENERKRGGCFICVCACVFVCFVCLFHMFLPAFASVLLAHCLSCDSLATALGYHGASLLFGAPLVLFWRQFGSFGSSWALWGCLLALFLSSLGPFWGSLGLSWDSWNSFGAFLSLLGHARELSWKEIALGLLFCHFLDPKK